MARRMTDTGKWDHAWFQDLPCRLKAFREYLVDRCTFFGVWVENYRLASQLIGEPVSEADLPLVDKRFQRVRRDKIFLPGFIEFQYQVGPRPEDKKFNLGGGLLPNGKINKGSNVHRSVVRELRAIGIDPSTWIPPVIPSADGFIHNTPPLPTLGLGLPLAPGQRQRQRQGEGEGQRQEGGSGGENTLNPASSSPASDEEELLVQLVAARKRNDFPAVNRIKAQLTRLRLDQGPPGIVHV